MFESINVNKSTKQFIVFDMIPRTIKDSYKIARIKKMTMQRLNYSNDLVFQRSVLVEQKKGLYAKRINCTSIYLQSQR